MTTSQAPQLKSINMQRRNRQLVLSYENGESYNLSYEYLRVHSPSAEVKGHGPGQEVLQKHKEDVLIDSAQPVGNYAVQLFFNDGHDSGIFSWNYLYELAINEQAYWANYLQRLEEAGIQRKSSSSNNSNVVNIFDPSQQ